MPRSKPRQEPVAAGLEPYWQTEDGKSVRLYLGDVIEVLRGLPEQSVHTVITSPPYWGLRCYGTAAAFPTEQQAREWAEATSARWNQDRGAGGRVRFPVLGVSWDEVKKAWVGRVGSETLWEDGSWCAYGSEPAPEGYIAHEQERFAWCPDQRLLSG